jgi:hypothetical protein
MKTVSIFLIIFVALPHVSLAKRTIRAACPPGTYQPNFEASFVEACLPCPLGTYNPNSGRTACDQCSTGYYCDVVGGTTRKACPAGTYQTNFKARIDVFTSLSFT